MNEDMNERKNTFSWITFVLEHWIFPVVFIMLAGGILWELIGLIVVSQKNNFVYFSRLFRYFLLLLFCLLRSSFMDIRVLHMVQLL